MPDAPTPAQIAQVQSNLARIQRLNDYIFTYGQPKVLNAYFLLSQTDNSDPGLFIGLQVLEGAFWAIGSEFGAAGSFVASFLSGMVSSWTSSAPPSLKTTFASLETRLANSSIALDTTLADLSSDVAGNWNASFSYQGQTATLSTLAGITVPPESDPSFEAMANAAIFGLDQQIWATVMKANFVITTYGGYNTPITVSGTSDKPPIAWAESFLAVNPSYSLGWVWYSSGACCPSDTDPDGWRITESNIGTGASGASDGAMSAAACAYLFIDSVAGVVINSQGLFNRTTVFFSLGIRQTSQSSPFADTAAAATPSLGYLRAVKEGRTLQDLIAREGRAAVERRIVEEAQRDSIFAVNVSRRPRQTLEAFLGVRIPDVVNVTVVVESSRSFGLVIPQPATTKP